MRNKKPKEDINIDDLKKWKQSTDYTSRSGDKVKVHSDGPVDVFEEPKKKNPFKERKLKKDHWNNEDKTKTIINCRDGEVLKIYYPLDQTTGERLMNFWFTKNYNPTVTITGAIQIKKDIEDWFFSNKFVSLSKEGTILRNSIRDKYFIDIITVLIERESITTKEFAEIINIKEQDARKHLNNLEKEGLLKSYRYNKGKKLYRFALSKEKIEDMKMFLGL